MSSGLLGLMDGQMDGRTDGKPDSCIVPCLSRCDKNSDECCVLPVNALSHTELNLKTRCKVYTTDNTGKVIPML